jgi:uncharacterized protein YkwD
MKRLLFFLTLLFIPLLYISCYAQIADSTVTYYQALNQAEMRLPEFKDSEDLLRLKLIQLALINKSRKKYHAQPVKLDILASRVANKMCKEAAENKYLGHWDMAGEKPYHRYAFAGGMDHVAENAASSSYSGKQTFAEEPKTYTEEMSKLHLDFMAERAPDDAHKKNCIEKEHNFVGIGAYRMDKEFRYYEEFIDRYYTFLQIPAQAAVNVPVTLELKPGAGNYFYYLIAFREDITPMTPSKISSRHHYDDFGPKKNLEFTPWALSEFRKDATYEIPLTFNKPGYYYIAIYQSEKEYKKPTAFNTDGKIQASGIVIEVK